MGGAFEIICRVGPVNYEIRVEGNGKRKKVNVVHVNNLKVFQEEVAQVRRIAIAKKARE